MKAIKILISAFIIVIVSAVSFYSGREYEAYYYNFDSLYVAHQELKDSCQKHYEAACLQADFIRSLMDWDFNQTGPSIGSEIEESYYEWFQDLELGNYKTKKLTDIKQLEAYHWCY